MLEECFSCAIRGGAWWHSRNSAGWEFGLRGTTRSGTKGVHCTDLGQLKNHQKGDFPGTSNAGGRNSITDQEIKIPYATWPSTALPKKKERKKEKLTRKGRSRNRQKNQYNTVKFKNKIKYIKKKDLEKNSQNFLVVISG